VAVTAALAGVNQVGRRVISSAANLLDHQGPPPPVRLPAARLVVRPAPVYQGGGRTMSTEPEAGEAAEVMARYCRGDAAAFHRLYALLAPRILAYLTGLIGERAAAEDLLQLTFLKLHEARSSYVLGADPIPWIYTIAHRTCLDEIRKRKRSRVHLSRGGEPAAEPAAHITGVAAEAHPDPADRPDPAAAAGALAALAKLPDNQRQALILTKVHGRSVADAALITGSTPGAIKQRAHRAYVTLRQLLGRKEVA
jgi:RNA polymerase sigma factor (sigma-70 family)